jgi:hypothetical protein
MRAMGFGGAVLAAALVFAGCTNILDDLREQRLLIEHLSEVVSKLPEGPERKALEADIAKLRQNLQQTQTRLEYFGHVASDLERKLAAAERAYLAPERMVILFSSEAQDWDGDGVDDGLRLRLEFLDEDEDPVKVRGGFRFDIHLTNPITGGKGRKIATIFVSPDEAARYWRHTGYNFFEFKLKWPDVFVPSKVFVAVTFVPVYGRPLYAVKEFEVKR